MTRIAERVARGVGVGALVLALLLPWLAERLGDPSRARHSTLAIRFDDIRGDSLSGIAQSTARDIAAALLAAGATPDGAHTWPTVRALFSVVPSNAIRSVLGAAKAAGLSVQWRDSSGVTDIATAASRSATPRATTVLDAHARSTSSAPSGSLVLRDAGGVLDSASTASIKLRATQLRAPVRADVVRNTRVVASALLASPTPLRVRDVLLYARAGWESKFVTAALEESGWVVEGTIALSPTSRVRLGAPQPADTSRYAAVVVLDSGLVNARALERFVAQGGGVVMAGEALRDGALSLLSPARVVDDRAAIAGALLTDQPRRGLPAFHLAVNGAPIVLEAEGGEATVVVARRGIGRVMSIGYRGTWHWRMEGREESADDHRRWWNDMVAAVAYAADTSTAELSASAARSLRPGDAAPVADLYARLGPPQADDAIVSGANTRAAVPLWLLYLVSATALLIEWGLRRVRGAP